ncbi:YihY/virulence factor BrkB family protein [Flavobacterium sp. SUN052]|uniref:YihY/virulence factor BrkB family protein n=1 Tax=Flavobacterium sp. SUN052 TaxID=3002441 RepID=UPI00237D6C35|nr:YihY/virulence factor BrkB family protein [Flavobacterium sp. SUN052]MEC4005722.1 YihY/virulence factor BrkB family protein [Flavobacterium sp. SUN052]
MWEVLKNTKNGFLEHKVFKMSAALAYTTVFSMAPLLLVILYVCDIFWSRAAIEGAIYGQLKNFIGPNGAFLIQSMIKSLSFSNKGTMAGTVGIITLLIGATSVFAEIQDSINTIWGIRPKKKSGFWLYLKSRLLSFGVIGSLGFILLVSLGLSTIMDSLSTQFLTKFSFSLVYLVYILNLIITFLIITFLFGSIFTILPDADISWKQIRVSAITTALLFMLGKFLISYYIASSNINSVYGSAGSLVVLMVWVYYSSVILYLGAEFAKAYAIKYASDIKPSKFAEIIHQIEITSDEKTLQNSEKELTEIKKTPGVN